MLRFLLTWPGAFNVKERGIGDDFPLLPDFIDRSRAGDAWREQRGCHLEGLGLHLLEQREEFTSGPRLASARQEKARSQATGGFQASL